VRPKESSTCGDSPNGGLSSSGSREGAADKLGSNQTPIPIQDFNNSYLPDLFAGLIEEKEVVADIGSAV
jgi:hypothetical protein